MENTKYMKSPSKLLIVVALLSVLLPVRVFACACCAEPGDYYEDESDFSGHMLSEVEKIGLATATLHTDAGFPESIKGFEPLGESFSIDGFLKGQTWVFELTDAASKKSVLILWRPQRIVEFGVDQNPVEEDRSVTLYKELRIKYRVQSATGFLKDSIDAETTFNLVLQGRGNRCLNASDFSTYILQINGNKADYSFFGKLKISEDTLTQ